MKPAFAVAAGAVQGILGKIELTPLDLLLLP
jgi:hypothetical protein